MKHMKHMKRMKRSICVIGFVGLGALAAACGGGNQHSQLDIRLSEPAELSLGDNAFEAMVMQGSQPVTDAEVSLELFMAAMPSMDMPEMRSTVAMTHEGGGRYRGTGDVVMGGAWDATVMVMRGGEHLGDRTVTIIAR
ncbi:MAG: FixH family protein [Acidobacteria bacterium]|nr:FixH family protein [Acidobacteriota bacterium]